MPLYFNIREQPFSAKISMNLANIATFAYGILALVGGIIGYVQVKSKMSLISGLISGILLLGSGVLMLQGQTVSLILALVVTSALIIVFAIRLIKTRKFMPAGLMLGAGLVTLVCLVGQLLA